LFRGLGITSATKVVYCLKSTQWSKLFFLPQNLLCMFLHLGSAENFPVNSSCWQENWNAF